ncbi:MAG: hypothetical protein CMF25_03685 [Kangiellaceae bacterium]|jgi:flagellar biosynthesis protein|nr:hypothetical protein [Kangiellaceae bacterium]|tara:strand:+ start:1165 stop:1512 length:348 start_codon:yes stop_codon:yes gene_type:complete
MTDKVPPETADKAVALNYDGTGAPTIVAQGIDEIAEAIIELARASDVYLHQDPVLTEMLLMMELGNEIPKELYITIAEILSFAYYLKGKVPDNYQPKDDDDDNEVILPQLPPETL